MVGAVGGDLLVLVEGRSGRARFGVAASRRGSVGGGGAPAILDTERRVVIEADPDGPGRATVITV